MLSCEKGEPWREYTGEMLSPQISYMLFRGNIFFVLLNFKGGISETAFGRIAQEKERFAYFVARDKVRARRLERICGGYIIKT